MSFFRELVEYIVPEAYAETVDQDPEEPADDVNKEVADDEDLEDEEDGQALKDSKSDEGEEEEEEEEGEEEDEEDEEDEESNDPMEIMREECIQTPACKENLHHFQECEERVKKEQEEPGYEEKHYKEDCVEEFFHFQHSINDCVAPTLFFKLK